MKFGVFFCSCVITAIVLSIVILCVNTYLRKRQIKESIMSGTKYVYYGVNGDGNPFLDPNVYISIIKVKGNHVLYQREVKAPELRPSLMEFVDTKALSIPEFTQKIYKLKNVNITLP